MTMTDKQFRDEVRRGILTIMRACIVYFCMSWDDFKPREASIIISALAKNQSAAGYLDATEKRPG